jgi:hypothetical protein
MSQKLKGRHVRRDEWKERATSHRRHFCNGQWGAMVGQDQVVTVINA